MLSRTSLLGMLVVFVTVVVHQSGVCQGYQIKLAPVGGTSYHQERRVVRRSQLKEDDDSSAFSKVDVFGIDSEESLDHSHPQEIDSSGTADEIRSSVLDIPLSKRRKGPTLSVVNPLEILRQRLMLDLAQRRIHQNQQQIVANAQLLENIGKRSSNHRHLDDYQP